MTSPDYLVGKRVYNGGSSMPTSGTVDPSGYIARGINQQSEKRSGLAAAALSRINDNKPDVPSQDPNTAAPTTPIMATGPTIKFQISPTGRLIPDFSNEQQAPGQMQPPPPVDNGSLMAAALARLGGQ